MSIREQDRKNGRVRPGVARSIAIDARSINSSTGTYVERMLAHLQVIDTVNNYVVLVRAKDASYWTPAAPNFRVMVAEYDNYSVAEQFGFKRFLEAQSFDLVHFCMPQQPVWYRGRRVTTFHDLTLLKTYNSDKNWLSYHLKQIVGRFVFRAVAGRSDAIIVPSLFTKKDLIDFFGVPAERISLTYEAAEVTATAEESYELPFTHYILYVGNQSDYKNIALLARAHQLVKATHPGLGLVLAGKLDKAALTNRDLFDREGFRDIVFTGFVSNSQRDYLYHHASAYVFPSLMEGFGLPGLEAMLRGAPVASSNATCLPEIYGDAALYFDPTSVEDAAHTIGRIIDSPELAADLVRRGHEQASQYSWRRMAEQTKDVYDGVLAR